MTLSNAAALSSLSGYTPEEENYINDYVSNVLSSTIVDSLSDKEKIIYLKLWFRFRGKNLNTLNVDDYVTPERQQLIDRLQDDFMYK